MWRSILGVAAFEFIVMLVLLLAGAPIFGYEYNFVGVEDYTETATGETIASDKVHVYTILFNTFVFMNIGNFFNARLLGINEYMFWEVFTNPIRYLLFLVMVAGISFVQIMMVNVGGQIFRTVPLTTGEMITSIVLGLACLGVGVGLKFTPPEWVERIPIKLNEDDDVASQDLVMSTFKSQTAKKPKKK